MLNLIYIVYAEYIVIYYIFNKLFNLIYIYIYIFTGLRDACCTHHFLVLTILYKKKGKANIYMTFNIPFI